MEPQSYEGVDRERSKDTNASIFKIVISSGSRLQIKKYGRPLHELSYLVFLSALSIKLISIISMCANQRDVLKTPDSGATPHGFPLP